MRAERRGMSEGSLVGLERGYGRPRWTMTTMASRDHFALLLRYAGGLKEGKHAHAAMASVGLDTDTFLGNHLLRIYGREESERSLGTALAFFRRMPCPNVFSWTIASRACLLHGRPRDALRLFWQMQSQQEEEGVVGGGGEAVASKADKITLTTALDAAAKVEDLAQGKSIHACIVDGGFDVDFFVGTAVLNMYGKSGSLGPARLVFDRLNGRDCIAWNAMIAAYAQNGADYGVEALKLFRMMQAEGVHPDVITFISVLDACASLSALARGKEIHGHLVNISFETNIKAGTALVHLYGKCGLVDKARHIFNKMGHRNVVSWTAMLIAYALNGYGKEALKSFRDMREEGIVPNAVTFIGLLCACSHTGLSDAGRRFFDAMKKDYGVNPVREHYRCMIDLLGRVGLLEEAEDIACNMPFQSDVLAWLTLLGACRNHGDTERAARTAERVLEIDPKNASAYVLLVSTYAKALMWEDVAKVRKVMRVEGVKKPAGQSWIEVGGSVHEFFCGDSRHPRKAEIDAELSRLITEMKEAGYIPDTSALAHDVDDEKEKEWLLLRHSEKLAIGYGILATPPGTPLRVVNNLRMCPDCHIATRFISKLTRRKIIVRDSNRFHHFEDGICSCGDYW